MDAFVLDCSLAVAWCFPDEQGKYADSVLAALGRASAIVPAIWPAEVANALLMAERRKRSTPAETARWLGLLESLPIAVVDRTDDRSFQGTLDVARNRGLSVYDASYLELCLRRGLELATLDRSLARAAGQVGVTVFRPDSKV
jgi:predicted nucleic acid-binding protein